MDLREHIHALRSSLRQRGSFDASIPAVSGQPLLGSLVGFRERTFETLRAAEQGDLVRLDLLYRRTCLTGHPDGVAALLDSPDDWEKSTGLAALLGKNVLTTIGDEWAANRQLAQPSFHQKMAARAAASFARDAEVELDGWGRLADGGAVDLALESTRLFALLAPRSFGLSLRPDEAHRFPEVVQRLQRWAFRAVAGGQPRTRQVEQDLAFLDGIIDRGLATPAPPGEPPSFLERIRQDHQVDREALRGHLRLMLIASADNPPNTFAYTVWLLGHHPAWEAALRAEVEAAGRDVPLADLDALPLLDRIINESMRFYPPVWFLLRIARRDTALLGHRVPQGTMAFASIWRAHRHPAFWERPDVFDPDHFLPEAVERRHRYAFVPFGVGQRRCIGSRIALLEVKALLVAFLRRFRAIPVSRDLTLEGNFVLRSRDGVLARLSRLPARA